MHPLQLTQWLLVASLLTLMPPSPGFAEEEDAPKTEDKIAIEAVSPKEAKPSGTKVEDSKTAVPGAKPGGTGSRIVELVLTKSYVEFSELDPLPKGIIGWDRNSGKFLYISKDEAPFIFLFGKLKEGYEISFNDKWIPVNKGRFEFKVSLPLEPNVFSLKIFTPQRKFHMYRLIYSWSKFPPSLRYKVQEEGTITERAWGYSGKYSRSGWVQLYSHANPTPVVDLDAQQHAQLYFRIYYPPEPEDFYDSWSLTIRNSLNQTVGFLRRFGAPPSYVDWRDLSPQIFTQDNYTYQLNLYGGGGNVFEGKPNRFDTIEGHALLQHHYIPAFQFEPKGEIGYFSFANQRSAQYSGIHVGGDLPFVFENQFIARLNLSLSLHNLSESNTLNFTRIGAGFRFGGVGQNSTFGQPYFFRVDVYLNFTNFTLHPSAGVVRYSHPSILVEPHLLLWTYHYLVPWIEYGSRFRLEEQRLSFGLNYYFYIRPWATKFGLGFSYDNLIKFSADPGLKFTIFRTMAQLLFTF